MYTSILPACIGTCLVHEKTEEGDESPGTEVKDGREVPCGCCQTILSPLQK